CLPGPKCRCGTLESVPCISDAPSPQRQGCALGPEPEPSPNTIDHAPGVERRGGGKKKGEEGGGRGEEKREHFERGMHALAFGRHQLGSVRDVSRHWKRTMLSS